MNTIAQWESCYEDVPRRHPGQGEISTHALAPGLTLPAWFAISHGVSCKPSWKYGAVTSTLRRFGVVNAARSAGGFVRLDG